MILLAEGVSDRQAADAVRCRIDWKYVIRLELTDADFDALVLSGFRGRLVENAATRADERVRGNLCYTSEHRRNPLTRHPPMRVATNALRGANANPSWSSLDSGWAQLSALKRVVLRGACMQATSVAIRNSDGSRSCLNLANSPAGSLLMKALQEKMRNCLKSLLV